MTTVTDADREAAMAREVSRGYTQRTRNKVLRGEKDEDELVQAFARHRQAAILEGMEMGIEAMRQSVEEVESKGLADYCAGALNPAAIIAQHTKEKNTP